MLACLALLINFLGEGFQSKLADMGKKTHHHKASDTIADKLVDGAVVRCDAGPPNAAAPFPSHPLAELAIIKPKRNSH